ncbi:MAG: TIGR02147 family protein [Fibrobacteria bacterium]
MPDIFAYTSYARFLRDWYAERKRRNPKFSYETLSRKAGFKSRSNLIEVSTGKKALTLSRIFGVAKALELGPGESEYFESLVRFNNAATLKEREFHLAKLGGLAGKTPGRVISEGQFAYFSEWHHPVVRELVCMPGFDGDFSRLAKTLRPVLTARQAKDSVELLQRLGLLEKTAHGRYRQADGAIQTEDELTSFIILRYQKENLRLAEDALDTVDPRSRDISTLTAGVSKACFLAVKKEIQAFRRHLSKIVEKDEGPDRVYQLNLQFFPVSETPLNTVSKTLSKTLKGDA